MTKRRKVKKAKAVMPYDGQYLLGAFQLGPQSVDVVLMPNMSGGEFYFIPEEGRLPRIKIGLDYANWYEVVDVVVHEALEYLLTLNNHRFVPSGKFNADHANYQFMFDHVQLTTACAQLGVFLANALPKIAEEFNKHIKSRSKG